LLVLNLLGLNLLVLNLLARGDLRCEVKRCLWSSARRSVITRLLAGRRPEARQAVGSGVRTGRGARR
jgi:hypothetical protein